MFTVSAERRDAATRVSGEHAYPLKDAMLAVSARKAHRALAAEASGRVCACPGAGILRFAFIEVDVAVLAGETGATHAARLVQAAALPKATASCRCAFLPSASRACFAFAARPTALSTGSPSAADAPSGDASFCTSAAACDVSFSALSTARAIPAPTTRSCAYTALCEAT